MSDRLHSLGEIVETIMGQAPPGSACNKEGRGTVFVKAGEFADPLPLVREWTTKPIKRAWSTDVLVCVVGATAGKVSRSIDCAIGRSVAAIRPIEKHVDSGYLFHFLSTKTLFLREKSQGLAQGVITRDMIESLDLHLPRLAEQRRIAAILDQADALRRKRGKVIYYLEKSHGRCVYRHVRTPDRKSIWLRNGATRGTRQDCNRKYAEE